MEDKYQRDMDRVRVTDVDYLATLVADYLKKTGTLPLSSKIDDKDIEVFISHREIPQSILEQAAKLPIRIMPVTDLKSELEAGLKKDIKLPSDPQNVATFAPNLYVLHVNTKYACVAGHLYFARDKARNVDGKYYKYERCVP